MSENIRKQAEQMINERKKHRKTVCKMSIAGILVVMIVMSLLTLPVIAMDAPTYCGLEYHVHTDSCYTPVACCGYADGEIVYFPEIETYLVCTLPEITAHIHDENCYDEETGEVVCGTSECIPHIHDEVCYDEQGNLICGLEEIIEHQHSEACYATRQIEVPYEHHHIEACYVYDLTCTIPEHIHLDSCFVEPVSVEPQPLEPQVIEEENVPLASLPIYLNDVLITNVDPTPTPVPTYSAGQKIFFNNNMIVVANYTEDCMIPDDAILQVIEVFPDDPVYQARQQQINEQVPMADTTESKLYHIAFVVDGVEILIAAPYNIEFQFLDDEYFQIEENTIVTHFDDIANEIEIIEPEINVETNELSFEAPD